MRRRISVPIIVSIILLGILLIAALSQRRIEEIFVNPPTQTTSPNPTPTPTESGPTSTPTPPKLTLTPTTPPAITPSPTLRQARIIVSSPIANQVISSPLTISGQAQGFWFFEATAPVRLVDGNGQVLATSFITAQGEWMTENLVLFTGQLTFSNSATSTGQLILEKSNPSGLPQNDQQVIIPVRFR